MTFTEDSKQRLKERIHCVLNTHGPEGDDVSEFVRSKMRDKAVHDWDRSKHRAGLTLEERAALDDAYDGPNENWRWHLYHVDPEVWRFLTFCNLDEYEPLTTDELIRDYPEYAIEQGLLNDDPTARLGIKVGSTAMLKAKRGPDRMIIVEDIVKGRVKAIKYIEEDDRWTGSGYVEADDLYDIEDSEVE